MTVPTKTAQGYEELRSRTHRLSQRHRTVLLLVDGRRPLAEVLSLAQKAGSSTSHFEDLLKLGLVDLPQPPATAAPPLPPPGEEDDDAWAVTAVPLDVEEPPSSEEQAPVEAGEAEPETPWPAAVEAQAMEAPPAADAPSAEDTPPVADASPDVEVPVAAEVPAPPPELERPPSSMGESGAPSVSSPPEPRVAAVAPGVEELEPLGPPSVEPMPVFVSGPIGQTHFPATAAVRADEVVEPLATRMPPMENMRPVMVDPVPSAAPPVVVPPPVSGVEASPQPRPDDAPTVQGGDSRTDSSPLLTYYTPPRDEPTPSPRSTGLFSLLDLPDETNPLATGFSQAPASSDREPVAQLPIEVPLLGPHAGTQAGFPDTLALPEPAAADGTPGGTDLQRVRELLIDTLSFDKPLFSARMFLRVWQAHTAGQLIDVVWEIQDRLVRARHAHRELKSLQQARELLGLGNTLVSDDTRPQPLID